MSVNPPLSAAESRRIVPSFATLLPPVPRCPTLSQRARDAARAAVLCAVQVAPTMLVDDLTVDPSDVVAPLNHATMALPCAVRAARILLSLVLLKIAEVLN
jgi:hypothetical protein